MLGEVATIYVVHVADWLLGQQNSGRQHPFFHQIQLFTRSMENCLYMGYFYWHSTIGMGGLVVKAPASDATGDGFDGCPSNICYLL